MKKYTTLLLLFVLSVSCVSTKSTIKNIDDNAPTPQLTANNTFVISEYSTDKKYGYDPDYPINVFFRNVKDETINQQRFLNALTGPKGEKLVYSKVETCCPFPTKKSEMGAGLLDIYEITWNGNQTPVKLYFNIFEKGALLCPIGLKIK